uniref:Uncharacterized protein n=1 Tax=Leersia perrieri TaxID=77586 RepID=A0A0D9WIW2_9ORYZ
MLCWPLYAEQKMNKVVMVEEMGIAMELVGWQQGLVKGQEVEARVRLVMESNAGNKLRKQVMAHKERASMAWTDGGMSRVAFARFLSNADSQRMHINDKLMDHGYAVTAALIDPTFQQQINFPTTVNHVVSSKPAIRFHKLPRIELSDNRH